VSKLNEAVDRAMEEARGKPLSSEVHDVMMVVISMFQAMREPENKTVIRDYKCSVCGKWIASDEECCVPSRPLMLTKEEMQRVKDCMDKVWMEGLTKQKFYTQDEIKEKLKPLIDGVRRINENTTAGRTLLNIQSLKSSAERTLKNFGIV